MAFYDDMQELASSIMKNFKQGSVKLVQYKETKGGTLDEPSEMAENVYDLDATVSGVSYKYLINSYAVASDLTVTAGVIKGVTPTINDFIEIEGVRHKIIRDISAAPNAASGKPVVWRFICRKG
ncbi:MAG: hypothetical protein J6W96_06120 [Alphaproteobacteria bacterium]|nr:hypothetical protein [Alphaproteobacteria bacterium]